MQTIRGGLLLEDRLEEVLEKYDFTVIGRSRARGAVLLDTDRGYKLIKETRTSAGRLVWENKVKNHLVSRGIRRIDSFILNKDENISTQDSGGVRYVVRDWYIGEECDLRSIKDIRLASSNLADLHNNMIGLASSFDGACADTENISVVFKRHNSELKHIKNYLRSRNDKNEFEIAIHKAFPQFYEQAEKAVTQLGQEHFKKLCESTNRNGEIFHGSYTYHNILMCSEGIATTVFDKCSAGIQIMDLYYFLRKVMEKNEWSTEFGNAIMDGYESVKKMSKDEKYVLANLLLYPEKFWKLASYYMNGKKTWISHKNIEKLLLLCSQAENREKFIRHIV